MKCCARRILSLLVSACLAGSGLNLQGQSAPPQTEANRQAIHLEALSRLKGINLDANPAVKTVVLKVLGEVRGTPQFVELVRDFKLQGQAAGLLEVAEKHPGEPAAVEALRLLLKEPNLDLLKQSLGGTNALNLVPALGDTGEKEMVPLVQPLVPDTRREVALRKAAVKALVKVQDGAVALLELAKAQKLPDDLKLTASSELNGVRWESLRAQAAQLLPMPASQSAHPLPPISELAKMKGDPARGTAVFRRDSIGCYKCHLVNGQGVDFGPNLSEIGTKLAKDAIYEAILDPSAGIAFGFEAWTLELKDGEEAFGLIVSETADQVAVKAVGGLVTRYQKAEIRKRTQQKLSIMPAGLAQTMSTQDLVDLVEYLSSLNKATK